MVTSEENARLTQVGSGTPMGELLRRYWHPVAAVSELDDKPIKRVRLMGEDLTLYKDHQGRYGLVDRHCAHRRADLSFGMVEDCGIRCSYHGWRYDEEGRCIEQPFDDTVNPQSRFKDAIRLTAYPIVEMAGLLWAYLGPDPAPLVPNWEPFTWDNCFVQIALVEIPCNWLQCQENSIDPVHVEWQHMNWANAQMGKDGPPAPRHVELDFEEWDHGFVYKRILETTDENDEQWQVGRVCVLPNLFVPYHFEWRVPIDDTNTLLVVWFQTRLPPSQGPFTQERIPHWYGQMVDPVSGELIVTHVINQDAIAWVGQGAIADRTREHLGREDRGVILLRRQLERDMEAVAEGRDPKGVVRDPEANRCISWPNEEKRARTEDGLTLDDTMARQQALGGSLSVAADRFVMLAGQPEEIRQALDDACGVGRSA